MHRRNRHIAFSAKNAGAILVLDARTIKGVSDNTGLDSWRDLSSKSRIFGAGLGRQPTYRTNIQGGQPLVRFDATANSNLGGIMTVSWLTSENPSQYVWIGTEIPRVLNSNRHLVSTDDGSFNQVNFSLAHTPGWFSVTNAVGTNVRGSTGSWDYYPATISVNTPYVQSLGWNGSVLFFYRGDYASTSGPLSGSTLSVSTSTTQICLGGRLGGADLDTSDLMQFLLFNSFISKSLRRRFEVASFYTFKIKDTQNTANR